MHDNRVAKRYALALFQTAQKYDVIRPVEGDLIGIVSLLEHNVEFRRLLLSPSVSREEKLRIVEKLLSDRVTAITLHAVRLMLEKGREEEIEWVQRDYVRLRRDHENVLFASITTSEALDDELRKRVVDKLAQLTGKSIEPDFRIEPHLIGGIRVAYENYVLDGSLRGGLRRMKEHLLRDVLKQN